MTHINNFIFSKKNISFEKFMNSNNISNNSTNNTINSNNLIKNIKEYFILNENNDTESDESNCIYVNSMGIRKSSNMYTILNINNVNEYDFTKLSENDLLYIKPDALYHFSSLLNNISKKIILVSNCSDYTIPNEVFPNNIEFLNLINSDKIIHCFFQNCIYNHPKITEIPIGMDYHTISNENNHYWGNISTPFDQENLLINIKNNSLPFNERIIKCYSNFHFSINTKYGYDRLDAINNINKDLIFYEPVQINRIDSWKNQSQYAFSISPHGNGLDCHRTWEALILGCIPIVKKSEIDSLYAELPVLIVSEWSNITQELLENTMIDFKNKVFNYDKLLLSYWTKKFESYKLPILNSNHEDNTLQIEKNVPKSFWTDSELDGFNNCTNNKIGQITLDSIIGKHLYHYAKSTKYNSYLEIGTWNGLGSTKCFVEGFNNRQDSLYTFYSLECNTDKYIVAKDLYKNMKNTHILNEVLLNNMPADIYNIFPELLENKDYNYWNNIDFQNMENKNLFLNRPNLPKVFDIILLDGGEFTTWYEYNLIKDKCKILILDDTNTSKCKKIKEEIIKNKDIWKIIINSNERNGILICEKIK
jgi:hypothetical protein